MKRPTPPRTTTVLKVQLRDKSILDAQLVCYPRYRTFFRSGACCIDLRIDGVGEFSKKSNDYFGALIDIRRELEAKQIRLLCWGARKDVWPSGMQRDMGGGMTAYQLLEDGTNNPDARSIFEDASPETVGTVDEQKTNAEEWYRKARTKGPKQ